jgi:uncharacterized membrane protein YfcA
VWVTLLAAVAVLVGGLVRGYSGFGASMVWIASLSLVYPPASVVSTVLLVEVLASLALLPTVRGEVEWHSMRGLLVTSVLTMPVGVALLADVSGETMRVIVAFAILAATIAVGAGVQPFGEPGLRGALLAGSVSGLADGSTGIGGPPAVLFYFARGRRVDVGRATLIAYFLGTDSVGVLFMALAGLVDRTVLVHSAVFAPAAMLGVTAGHRIFHRRADQGFRAFVLVLLVCLSLAILVRAVVFS